MKFYKSDLGINPSLSLRMIRARYLSLCLICLGVFGNIRGVSVTAMLGAYLVSQCRIPQCCLTPRPMFITI